MGFFPSISHVAALRWYIRGKRRREEGHTMRILVVEDEQRLGRLLRRSLEAARHVVDVATDGETGLAAARDGEYDVIILDLGLPDIDRKDEHSAGRAVFECVGDEHNRHGMAHAPKNVRELISPCYPASPSSAAMNAFTPPCPMIAIHAGALSGRLCVHKPTPTLPTM